MTGRERDRIELGPRVMGALGTENDHRRRATAVTVIARRALVAEQGGRYPRRPKHRRPKLIRTATIIGGLLLVLGLAACVRPPDGVDVGPAEPPATVPPCQEDEPCWNCRTNGICGHVLAECKTPDGWPFLYRGPASSVPPDCTITATGLAPLLQPVITKPTKAAA